MMMKIPLIVFNKYFLATAFVLVWMSFFDPKDFFWTSEQKEELAKLQEKKAYYTAAITKAKQELVDLQNNPAAIEKFARERYMLKKDGEDVFIVEDTLTTKR